MPWREKEPTKNLNRLTLELTRGTLRALAVSG